VNEVKKLKAENIRIRQAINRMQSPELSTLVPLKDTSSCTGDRQPKAIQHSSTASCDSYKSGKSSRKSKVSAINVPTTAITRSSSRIERNLRQVTPDKRPQQKGSAKDLQRATEKVLQQKQQELQRISEERRGRVQKLTHSQKQDPAFKAKQKFARSQLRNSGIQFINAAKPAGSVTESVHLETVAKINTRAHTGKDPRARHCSKCQGGHHINDCPNVVCSHCKGKHVWYHCPDLSCPLCAEPHTISRCKEYISALREVKKIMRDGYNRREDPEYKSDSACELKVPMLCINCAMLQENPENPSCKNCNANLIKYGKTDPRAITLYTGSGIKPAQCQLLVNARFNNVGTMLNKYQVSRNLISINHGTKHMQDYLIGRDNGLGLITRPQFKLKGTHANSVPDSLLSFRSATPHVSQGLPSPGPLSQEQTQIQHDVHEVPLNPPQPINTTVIEEVTTPNATQKQSLVEEIAIMVENESDAGSATSEDIDLKAEELPTSGGPVCVPNNMLSEATSKCGLVESFNLHSSWHNAQSLRDELLNSATTRSGLTAIEINNRMISAINTDLSVFGGENPYAYCKEITFSLPYTYTSKFKQCFEAAFEILDNGKGTRFQLAPRSTSGISEQGNIANIKYVLSRLSLFQDHELYVISPDFTDPDTRAKTVIKDKNLHFGGEVYKASDYFGLRARQCIFKFMGWGCYTDSRTSTAYRLSGMPNTLYFNIVNTLIGATSISTDTAASYLNGLIRRKCAMAKESEQWINHYMRVDSKFIIKSAKDTCKAMPVKGEINEVAASRDRKGSKVLRAIKKIVHPLREDKPCSVAKFVVHTVVGQTLTIPPTDAPPFTMKPDREFEVVEEKLGEEIRPRNIFAVLPYFESTFTIYENTPQNLAHCLRYRQGRAGTAVDADIREQFVSTCHPFIDLLGTVSAIPTFKQWLDAHNHWEASKKKIMKNVYENMNGDNPFNILEHRKRKAMVKLELVNCPRTKPGRVITMPDNRITVTLGPIFDAITKQVKRVFSFKEKLVCTLGMSREQMGEPIEHFMEMATQPYFYENDFSAFDSSVSALLPFEATCYESLLAELPDASETIERHMNANIGLWRYDIKWLHSKKHDSNCRLRYNVRGTRRSGDPNTSVGNTLINLAVNKFILDNNVDETGQPAPITNYKVLCNGDDSFLCIDLHNGPKLNTKHAIKLLSGLGLTSNFNESSQYYDLEFCSGFFVRNKTKYYLQRKLGRVLTKIPLTHYRFATPLSLKAKPDLRRYAKLAISKLDGLISELRYIVPLRRAFTDMKKAYIENFGAKVMKLKLNTPYKWLKFDTKLRRLSHNDDVPTDILNRYEITINDLLTIADLYLANMRAVQLSSNILEEKVFPKDLVSSEFQTVGTDLNYL
jgi:hypothetical protein